MFQISPASPTSAPATIRQIPVGNGGKAGFSLSLGAGKPAAEPGEAAPTTLPDGTDPEAVARHAVAGTGKDLPEGEGDAATSDPEADKDESCADPAFAWFGMTPVVPEAAPATIRFGLPTPAVTLAEGEAGAVPQIELPAAPLGEGVEAAPVAGETIAIDPELVTGDLPVELQAIAPKIDGVELTRAARTDGHARIELPARELVAQSLAAMQPRAETPPVVMSALVNQLGGLIDIPEGFRSLTPSDPALNPLSMTPGALEVLRPNIVQSVAGPQHVAIDTTRTEWMTRTIERIEALRDSPNSRETSIRLSPDALGTVDVSIRYEGDRVHVRISADNPQARALLAEAQPRLTEIAEARGLKLGQTSVDAGTTGQGNQSQRHEAASRPAIASAPASVSGGETETNADPNADRRVA